MLCTWYNSSDTGNWKNIVDSELRWVVDFSRWDTGLKQIEKSLQIVQTFTGDTGHTKNWCHSLRAKVLGGNN